MNADKRLLVICGPDAGRGVGIIRNNILDIRLPRLLAGGEVSLGTSWSPMYKVVSKQPG
jgi:hypothetical protein